MWTITALLLHLGLNLQARNLNFGLLAGYVCANAHVIKSNDYATRVFYPMHSYHANGFIAYRFPNAWGIVAEPGYIRKGGVFDCKDHAKDRFDFQLNYIQLPVLANYYFTDKFYISFGPEFACLMNKAGNASSLPDTFTPVEENAVEISGLIGVNYSITRNIDLGLRYNHSLTYFSVATWINRRYPPGHGIMGYSNVYNQYLQLVVRYAIKPGNTSGP